MMPMFGTIKNSVRLAMMDQKWQTKKQEMNQRNGKLLSPEERQVQHFKEQLQEMRESKRPAQLDAKLSSGAKLTPEEIEYLRRHAPEVLKEYEREMQERENYKRQLRNCKSKEEVDRVKVAKMGEFLSAAKEISHNANIPKGKKLELLQKLMKRVMGIEAEHIEFEKTLQYASLPERDEEVEEEKKEAQEPEEITDTENSDNDIAQPKEPDNPFEIGKTESETGKPDATEASDKQSSGESSHSKESLSTDPKEAIGQMIAEITEIEPKTSAAANLDTTVSSVGGTVDIVL